MKEGLYMSFCIFMSLIFIIISKETGAIREKADLNLKCYRAATTNEDRALCEKVFGGKND